MEVYFWLTVETNMNFENKLISSDELSPYPVDFFQMSIFPKEYDSLLRNIVPLDCFS